MVGVSALSSEGQKPKTKRGKRYLENRAPKLIENDKTCLFVRGNRVSETGIDLLKDIFALKKPLVVMLKRKNPFYPFESEVEIEKFAKKYDTALFVFTSHSKKRPSNVVIGRLFNHHILDMFEFALEDFASIASFKNCFVPVGFKPCLSFIGSEFQQDPTYQRLKSLLIDLFRGPSTKKIRLQGIEYLISFSAIDGKIRMRSYRVLLKKSDTRVPRVELQSAGPSCDLAMRRNRIASNDLYKSACKTPKAVKVKKIKNVSMDVFGTKLGRIHVKQNLDEIRYTRIKGLKRTRSLPPKAAKKRQV